MLFDCLEREESFEFKSSRESESDTAQHQHHSAATSTTAAEQQSRVTSELQQQQHTDTNHVGLDNGLTVSSVTAVSYFLPSNLADV